MLINVLRIFSGNLFSKILGVIREVVTAGLFGTGDIIGANRIAQTGTLVPVNFFTNEALNSSFIPVYKKIRRESTEKADAFFCWLFILFCFLSIFISLFVFQWSTAWVEFLAPGLGVETKKIAVVMLDIMISGISFYLLSALLVFLAMAHDDFVPVSVRPVVQNIGALLGVFFAYWLNDYRFLALGFLFGYLFLFFWVAARVIKKGFFLFPGLRGFWVGRITLEQFWISIKPLIAVPFFLQGNIVAERIVASYIGVVAVSAIDYARFITETFVLFVSAPIAYVALSSWAGLDREGIRSGALHVVKLLLVVSLPVSAFIWLYSRDLVLLIYARGAFDEYSVSVTSQILSGFSFGMWAQVVGFVLVRALNASSRNKQVLLVTAISVLANVCFNFLAYENLGVLTLGIGYAIYSIVFLVGMLLCLGIATQFFRASCYLFVGLFLYVVLDLVGNFNFGYPLDFIAGILFFLVFWSVWILANTEYRGIAVRLIKRKWN